VEAGRECGNRETAGAGSRTSFARISVPFSTSTFDERETKMLLWIVVLLLVLLAIGGGYAVSNLLWLLLVVALIVAVFALLSGRRSTL
jgi:fatty acid desaturase